MVCYVRVDPEHTGRGIGSTLLERTARHARTSSPSPEPAAARDELAEGRVGSAAPRRQRVQANPLPLADDDRPRSQPQPPTWPIDVEVRALPDESPDLEPIHEFVQVIFPGRRPDLRRLDARVQRLRPVALVPRRGRGRDSPASRSVCQGWPRIARRAMSASSAFARTGGARGSASRSCGRRSSSSTRAGARVSPCTSTWTT